MFRIKACEGIYHYLSLIIYILTFFIFWLIYSTFNIPDCGDHIPWQTSESHELVPLGKKDIGKIPNIKGSTISGTNWGAGALSSSAIFSDTTQTYQGGIQGGGAAAGLVSLYFDASKYKTVFNDSYNEVVPSYIIMEYCIKY